MPRSLLLTQILWLLAALGFVTSAQAQSSTAPLLSSLYTTRASFNASISTGSSEAAVSLEYGPTTAYGSTLAAVNSPVAANQTNATCFFNLAGLQAGTTYHCRVNVGNSGYSTDMAFTTLEEPVISAGVVNSITDLSAVISGTVDRQGGQYTIYAQLGTTTAYGQTAGLGSTNLLTGPQPFSNAVSTLLPATTYHFRIAASDIFNNTYYGPDQTFTTTAASTPPQVQPNGLTANVQTPTRTELYLTWLKTGSSATTVSYEYGTTTSYGSVVTHATPRPVNRFEDLYVAPVQLTGLTPGTTYHVRAKAVNAQGTVYTDDRTFTTPAGPVLTTGAATGITDLAATLNGTVNTNSLLLEVTFEYGTTTSYGAQEWVSPFQQNTSVTPVNVSLTSLLPGTTYHYRIKAVNHWQPAEVFYGPDATFTTTAAATPPTITSLAASNFRTRSAQVAAHVFSGSSETSVKFEYGETDALGLSSATLTQPPSISLGQITSLSGLTPGTTYYFRCVVTNAEGSAATPVQTFSTSPATPPTLGAISVQNARTTAANVQVSNASAGSSDAAVNWDYGLTTAYGSTVFADTIAADSTRSIEGVFRNLLPLTTYHYRCRITSADGSATSADGTFTTTDAPVPATLAATGVSDLTATLNGSVTALSASLGSFFEIDTTTAYGQTVAPLVHWINPLTTASKSMLVTGLLPSTTYHFRFCVRDAEGNVFSGPDMTFTTAAPATPPSVTGSTAAALSAKGATLRANVSAGSSPASLVFQWGTTTAYGSQIVHSTPLETSASSLITDALSGLSPSTTYHYRLIATNNEGSSTGPDTTFTTPALPIVTTGSASNVQPASAKLNGSYDMQGASYTAVFDFGETSSYGSTISPQSGGLIIGGGGPIIIGGAIILIGGGGTPSATIATLPSTTYHFRLRLTDSYGNQFTGSDAVFTTPSAIEGWRQQHFGSTANSGNAADDACPAGDGIPNLMKYALWMDPAQQGTQPPAISTEVSGVRYLGMNFSRNPNAVDVIYQVQAADSPLGPWTTITTIAPGSPPTGTGFISEEVTFISGGLGTPATPSSDTVLVRDTVPLGSMPHRFLRLHVERQP